MPVCHVTTYCGVNYNSKKRAAFPRLTNSDILPYFQADFRDGVGVNMTTWQSATSAVRE